MATRSPSPGRERSRTRSPTPRSAYSRSPSPSRRRRYDSRSPSRSASPPNRRNGRHRSASRSRSRSRGRGRGGSRVPSEDSPVRSTKIVVERLSKNINEDHLYEIFEEFGPIKDLDLPINRTFGTNRGTAYILFDYEADAEAAIAHMHEAQVDGATINVSIVLPRRKLSPAPPTARRGANIDPRVPFSSGRGGPGPQNSSFGGAMSSGGGGGRRRASPGGRFGTRSDVYRPASRSPSRSPPAGPAGSRGIGNRHDSPSRNSINSRSRSKSPPRRRHGGGRNEERDFRARSRSRSYDSYAKRSRSCSPSRGHGHR